MSLGIYAFIDSQNLNLGIKDQGWNLDFRRFRVYLREKYKVEKAFLFLGYIRGNGALYSYLKNAGYELVFKKTVIDKSGKIKGNVDAELVLHAARIEYDNYAQAVIVSGDGDFACLIKYLVQVGKLYKVLVPNRRKYSQLLLEYVEYLNFMNDLKEKLGRGRDRIETKKMGVLLAAFLCNLPSLVIKSILLV